MIFFGVKIDQSRFFLGGGGVEFHEHSPFFRLTERIGTYRQINEGGDWHLQTVPSFRLTERICTYGQINKGGRGA